MKFLNFSLLLLVSLLLLSSCSTNFKTLDNGKKIDTNLIGTWKGSETDKQIAGFYKSWIMQRNSDGSFVLNFTFTENGKTKNWKETGSWWIKNNLFYEFHNESQLTDTYEYTILNENQVKFKSKKMSIEMNADSYEFIDNKVK